MRLTLFLCKEVEQQGAVKYVLIFTFRMDDTNNLTNDNLRVEGHALCVGSDNISLAPPPTVFLPVQKHRERLALAGLQLNVSKKMIHSTGT